MKQTSATPKSRNVYSSHIVVVNCASL